MSSGVFDDTLTLSIIWTPDTGTLVKFSLLVVIVIVLPDASAITVVLRIKVMVDVVADKITYVNPLFVPPLIPIFWPDINPSVTKLPPSTLVIVSGVVVVINAILFDVNVGSIKSDFILSKYKI